MERQTGSVVWDPDVAIVMTCALTPASSTISVWKPTVEGLQWGAKNSKNLSSRPSLVDGFGGHLFQKQAVYVSGNLQGFFMVPEDQRSWNFNFRGIEHHATLMYGVEPGLPLPFYDERHRETHFLNFDQGTLSDARGSVWPGEDDFEDWLL